MPPRANPLARPKHTANRLSAVYIGSGQPQTPPNNINTPPNGDSESIPDLPEPLSPGASSSGSGLPSPPATNSTGSGSTGDPQSIAVRERPLSFNSSSSGGSGNVGIRDLTFNTMFKGGNSRTLHRSTSSISSSTSERIAEGTDVDDEDDNNDNDSHNNDDDTARLDLRYPRATASNENVLALQRVKSLTQRNRMALDKLSAYPRADTRSPAPSHTSSSASGSSNTSRLSRRPLSSHAPPEPQLSGSETERESTSFHSTSNSNSNSTSSFHSHSNSSQSHLRTVSQHQPRTQTPPTPHRIRTRLPSAPSSPLKALARTTTTTTNSNTTSTSSNGSSPSRARKRVSIAVMDDRERDVYGPGGAVRARSSLALVNREAERDRGDITQAAMAAVASSRRRNSPTGAPRRRGALPLEFRADLGQGRMSTEPEPMTPYRATHTNNAHNRNNTHTYIIPVSASTSTSSSSFSQTPASSSSSSSFANTSASGSGSNHLTRSATVRERRGQPKWASEDLGGPLSASTASSSSASYIAGGRHQEGREYTRDRRESVMGMGEYRERRQSLRAGSAESALAHGTGGRSFFVEGLKAAGLSPSKSKAERVSSSGARHGGGGGGGDVFTREHDDDYDDEGNGRVGRARAGTLIGSRAAGGGGLAARATTSMADYRYLGRGDADDDDDDVGVGTRRELRGSKSAFPLREEGAATRNSQKQRERETSLTREREGERDMDRAASSMSRYTTTRAPQERYASPFGSKRYNSGVGPGAVVQAQTQTQEHARLMMESLAMFEGHIARLGLTGSGGGGGSGLGGGGGGNELVRTAQSVAGAAEKLNAMLRYGVSRTLEEQVDAEVEEGEGRAGAREMAEVWRRVGGEYREGQRVSDELIRGLTGLLLGVGKVVRDLASSGGEGQHTRSVSLDEEGLGAAGRRARGSMSPDVGTGGGGSNGGGGSTGGGSGSGRRSVESRRSWDPTTEALRDDASRRLSARAESALGAARSPSSFDTLRDQHRATPQPSVSLPTGPRNSTGNTQSMRRLFTPREQREQQLDAHYADAAMNQADSQEILYTDYEPSPTPASRHQNQTTLDRSRTLPSLSIPKPLPTLPSESLRRSQTTTSKVMPPSSSTVRDRDRRKVSVASISTVRANTTFPASLTTPSSATTALTAHTVSTSHTPDRTAFPSLNRTDSERSARSTVTFSRPSTVSVSALNGLQQQHLEHQRKRTGSGASSGAEPSTSVPPQRLHMMSGPETDQGARRKTLGARTPRASLDGAREAGGSGSRTATVHAADRGAAVALGVGSGGMLPPMNTARRERRRTVTDIWPRD